MTLPEDECVYRTSDSSKDMSMDLVERSRVHAQQLMSAYDGSHDFYHVERVFQLATRLMTSEPTLHFEDGSHHEYDKVAVMLGAWLHDIGDRKYVRPGEDPSVKARDVLVANGADIELAEKVQLICTRVSYSHEIQHIDEMQAVLRNVPEIAFVQDADRLDALGSVGIARCFTFGAAKDRPMADSINHFEDKLFKLESMMKTKTGKRLARVRTEKLRTFYRWWREEEALADFAQNSQHD
ncbi:MAG: hypothetical protein M1828_007157 [Chrysothrix sp. TS-e1954]|nr:MAG: hypothetical protein M1828_007157 [Chrysothrix sp. TS-e1954]